MTAIEYRSYDSGGNIARDVGPLSPSPIAALGPFNVTFATAGLTTGVVLWTPPVGTLIYDIIVSVPTAFNGTTPKLDVGTFNGGSAGLFAAGSGVIDLTAANATIADNAGLTSTPAANEYLGAGGSALAVTAANPFLLVVSQDGTKGGSATGATAGAASVFIFAATPFAPSSIPFTN